ncbi:hypothetical protein PIB30_098367 [Stylosanthes scabra]|uniref:Replication protein A 70 kDa DNA-binding subunit B/D first OB fold domain-containing protein n=1 Tax=Stylosanthes scabra TaxID=79078 RepID=A0ABU6WWH2_9FABA|nr:hypothetical protein [Stylosanthes scabra]
MAQNEHFLADVHARFHDWNFNVYVIRVWEVLSKSNPKEMTHVELILRDSKGDRLHAVLPRSLISRWGPILAEFKLFNMRFFIVVENSMRSRTIATNLSLTFYNRTVVSPVLNPTFPLEALRLRGISDIL